jgi:hypothetical protein
VTDLDVTMSRRAKIRLTQEDLRIMLDLPEGLTVVAVATTVDPPAIFVHVVGEELEPQPPFVEAPFLGGVGQRTVIVGEDGKLYARWGWEQHG